MSLQLDFNSILELTETNDSLVDRKKKTTLIFAAPVGLVFFSFRKLLSFTKPNMQNHCYGHL